MATTDSADTWLVAVLRCSVFTAITSDMRNWFSLEQITGNLPDQVVSNPKIGTQEEICASGGVTTSLKYEPGRVDLVQQAQFPEDARTLEEIPNFGLFQERHAEFRHMCSKLFGVLDAHNVRATRVAFGPELIQPVPDRRSGYVRLNALLSVVEVDPESTDFIYGVNRHRMSTAIAGVRINRLSRWSVRRIDAKMPDLQIHVSLSAVHVLLDINSIPDERRDFSAREAESLFGEFVGLAGEIARQGDCK